MGTPAPENDAVVRLRKGRRARAVVLALELAPLVLALAVTQVLSKVVWNLPNGDVDLYQNYAVAFWLRRPPMHSLPVEYPPLALGVFMLTLVPPTPFYHIVFAVWMAVLVLLGYRGMRARLGRTRGYVYVLYLVVGTLATVLSRFDIVPALVTLAALWSAERGRFGSAYLLIATGVLLKLYPALLIPVVAVAHWRALAAQRARMEEDGGRDGNDQDGRERRWWHRLAGTLRGREARKVARGVTLCCAAVVAGFLPALIVNTAGALSGFVYAEDRPLQIESTPATLLWLGTIVGIPAHPDYSFTSLNYVGTLDVYLKPLSALALVAGCLWVYWRQARGRLTMGQAFLACLCVVLVTNKIFSPQYLIWVLPLVAYIEGFDLVWLAICLSTLYEFPIIYQMRAPILTVPYSWQFMPTLALRNGLLLYATVRAIMRPRRGSSTSERATVKWHTAGLSTSPGEPGEAEPSLAGQDTRT